MTDKLLKKVWDRKLVKAGVGHPREIAYADPNDARTDWYGDARPMVDGVELGRFHRVGSRAIHCMAPAWAMDDTFVRGLLLFQFPCLLRTAGHRRRAARWLWAITLVWRQGLVAGAAGIEMGLCADSVKKLMRRIRRTGNALKETM